MNILDSKHNITFAKMSELTESLGWGKHHYSSEEALKHTLSASAHVAYIEENNRIIAFGRIVEDGLNCMFYDICVHPDHQGKKIGTLIMSQLIDKIKDKNYVSIGLFCEDENKTVADFYSKLGFEHAEAMELKKYMRVY